MRTRWLEGPAARRATLGLALCAALAAASVSAQGTRPEAALYQEARQAEAALLKSPRRQLKAAEWESVILRYRRIVARYPQSPYCDDALLSAGDLYREMARRFKRAEYAEDARHAYETLATEYSSSSKRDDALYGVYRIAKAGSDRRATDQAARAYLDAAPAGEHTAEVKAQLRKTAAAPDSPTRAPAARPARATPSPEPLVREVSRTVTRPTNPSLVAINNVRFWSGESSTRVVLDVSGRIPFESDRSTTEARVWLMLQGARVSDELAHRTFKTGEGPLERIQLTQDRDDVARLVLDFTEVRDHTIFWLDNPMRLVIDVRGQPRPQMARAETVPAPAAAPSVAPWPVPTPTPTPMPPSSTPTPVGAAGRQAPPAPWMDAPGARPAASPAPGLPRLPSRRVATLAPPGWTPLVRASVPAVVAPARVVEWTAAPVRIASTSGKPGHAQLAPPPRVVPQPPSPPPPVARSAAAAGEESSAPLPAQVNRAGSYSLARQLGLTARRIVIDAGHGGHDPGSIGPAGLQEKDLTLDVAMRVAKLVRAELGAEVVMTRDSDVFVPLEERTAIANAKGADLFLSVHANSSRNPRAKGIETYYLNFAPDPQAEAVAARENAISAATLKDLQHLVKAIALNSKIDESHDFAASVQEAMLGTFRREGDLPDRGVRTAPFYVLIGANMPSILAEIAFVSNPEEERSLRTGDRRQRIAESLVEGVRAYLADLNRSPTRQLTDRGRASTVASREVRR